jgi:hypothetical protein
MNWRDAIGEIICDTESNENIDDHGMVNVNVQQQQHRQQQPSLSPSQSLPWRSPLAWLLVTYPIINLCCSTMKKQQGTSKQGGSRFSPVTSLYNP